MKIAELAKKVNLTPQELKLKITAFGFEIGKKSRTIKDKTAEEIIEKITKEKEFIKEGLEKEREKEIKEEPEETEKPQEVAIPEIISVKDLAAKIQAPVTAVIKELVKNGVMASINENIDFETAAIIADDFGYKVKKEVLRKAEIVESDTRGEFAPRPPVVTIVGHVDHGKTSLIDYIRKTNIMAGESGGITQHIGAYQIEYIKNKKKRKITFLDTPGHEAFVAMREHGTRLADIAILVVAADEGVMPQTEEAINHTKSAGVPIIVAITKIDKPEANIERVKKQLSEKGLSPEDWGGSTIIIPISSKTGEGVEELLEMIILTSDMEKIKADFSGLAEGAVIESHLDPKKGAVATVLIQKGYLNLRDVVVAGRVLGKIRIIENYLAQKIEKAGPSEAVRIYGLSEVPDYGEKVKAFKDEKMAKEYLLNLEKEAPALGAVKTAESEITKKLNLIIKADVAGSIKAVKDSIKEIRSEQGEIFVVNTGVGAISESEVMDADASKAVILGFRVQTAAAAKKLADERKIKILTFDVIYDLIDKVKELLVESIGIIVNQEEIGVAKVLKLFGRSKGMQVVGASLNKGKLSMGAAVKIFRKDQEIGQSKIVSLKVGKDDQEEVAEGAECGLGLEGKIEITEGDIIKAYQTQEKSAVVN